MRKVWTKEEEKILFDNYKIKTLDELSEMLGIARDKVKEKGRRHNLTFINNYWTEEEDNFLLKNYLTMEYAQIGKIIGRTRSAVQSRCRKLGLIKGYRSYKKELNSDYFEIIDTEEKAYWLGFICADGCVSWNKHTQVYSFKITLQKSDSDFLRKFVTAINGKFDINIKTSGAVFNGIYKKYDVCEVCFKDKKFTSDLLQYFSPNKTEYLRIPKQIPNDLIRHFIRGFSDGDGCFYCNLEKRNKSFEIVGKCYEMLEDIQKEFAKCGISSNIFRKRQTNWKLGIYRTKELVKLQSYLYTDATIFMDRKYNKSQQILKLAS